MRWLPAIALSAAVMLLSGCTKALEVDVSFETGLPVLTFRNAGMSSHPVDSICLWSAEIIDDTSGEAVMELRSSHDERDCARLSQVNFGQPGNDLKWTKESHTLLAGKHYHAEVVAEGARGRSKSWQQL